MVCLVRVLVRFTKNAASIGNDTFTCVFSDGSTQSAAMARRGVLPHEAFHFVVERTLDWHDAYFGKISRGETIEAVNAKVHAPNIDRATNIQALQSESLIECLEAEQSSGAVDPATFAYTLITTCRRRGVPPPDVTAEEVAGVRTAVLEFGAAWRPLPVGGMLERTF